MHKALETMIATVKTQILESLNGENQFYCKEWVPGVGRDQLPINGISDRPYGSFFNALNLILTAHKKDFHSHRWVTFKQARQYDNTVRKGEKGTYVIGWFERKSKDNEEEDSKDSKNLYPKVFTVFNEDQLKKPLPRPSFPNTPVTKHIKDTLALVDAVGVKYEMNRSDKCCYMPTLDKIELVPTFQFVNESLACSTIIHELCHATGHETRLDRNMRFGFDSDEYAVEEGIAETSAMLVAMTMGLPFIPNHSATYIASWIKQKPESLDDILMQSSKVLSFIQSAAKKADWRNEKECLSQSCA